MKLQEHDYGFEAELPSDRIAFTIKNSAKLFGILSSGIYKDKILAVIRELSCNAYDAHIAAKKKDVPFRLRLPTRIDPTFYVEDEGTGIDPKKIGEIYWTYGESTKTDSNDQIGALGLGSKSPFAYTKSSFIVKNRFNGREYIYLCFINEEGKPDGSLVSDEPTDKPSGITVEFAVRPEDITEFKCRTAHFFKRWTATLPIFVDSSKELVLGTTPIQKVLEGTDWYLESTNRDVYVDHAGAIAMQGNVPYPIEVNSIPRIPKELMIIASNPFIITFGMGEVNFAASRESLEYDERTRSNVITRMQEVRDEIKTSFCNKVFKPGMSHIEFIYNFRKVFKEFSTTIKYNADFNNEDWHIMLLCDKQKTDTVEYDGIKFVIEQLISGYIQYNTPKHQSFNISQFIARSKNSARKYMQQFSTVTYTTIEDIMDGSIIYKSWSSNSKIEANTNFKFDWKNPVIPKNGELEVFHYILQNVDLFTATTQHILPLMDSTVTFYVNDIGSSGEARYRALNKNGFFVNFNHKVTDINSVIQELNDLIATGMKGAEVKLLSTLPDNREVINKVKIEAGTMRAKYMNIIFNAKELNFDAGYNSNVNIKTVVMQRKGECILNIADLQAMSKVLYVVKRRSPTALYDDDGQDSIIKNQNIIALATKYCFPELVQSLDATKFDPKSPYIGRDSLFVMILNDSQIDWLKKQKVNLVNVRTLITERIEALQATEGFIAKIEEAITLQNITMIDGMYKSVAYHKIIKDRLLNVTVPSEFKELFIKYTAFKSSNNGLNEQYAKMTILEAVKGSQKLGHGASSKIISSLIKTYPLLNMLHINSYTDKSDTSKVIDYIEMIDSIKASQLN